MNKNLTNETFQKHLKLLHTKIKLNENVFEPDDDTISAKLAHWLDQNSSGYTSSFEVDEVLKDLNIKKGTSEFNELVDAFKESGFELKGNEFVKITKKGSGVSDKEVKDTANQYIKHFGKGSSSLQMSARDFVSMSQGGGDSDVRRNFPNWSDENFKQLLDILYTDGGLKRPVDEGWNDDEDKMIAYLQRLADNDSDDFYDAMRDFKATYGYTPSIRRRSSYSSRPPLTGKTLYFYNVPSDKQNDAYRLLKKTKTGKWYSLTPNPEADELFGKGRPWTAK